MIQNAWIFNFSYVDGKDDWYVFLFTADKFTGELIDCLKENLMIEDEKYLIYFMGRGKNFLSHGCLVISFLAQN
jgi:hypothetical protein